MSDMNVGSATSTYTGYQTGATTKANKPAKKDTTKQAEQTNATNDISKKNEGKLSSKAQDFLKKLRKQYGDYDFLVGNSTDDLKALSKSGSKEFSVIFSNAELERMANDEKYAREKIQGVEGAVKMCRKVCEQEGFISAFDAMKAGNGTVSKIGVLVDDNGNTKLFAELEKSSDKQKESVKRTTVEANSMEELIEKIKNVDWNSIEDSKSGDRFNFSV